MNVPREEIPSSVHLHHLKGTRRKEKMGREGVEMAKFPIPDSERIWSGLWGSIE